MEAIAAIEKIASSAVIFIFALPILIHLACGGFCAFLWRVDFYFNRRRHRKKFPRREAADNYIRDITSSLTPETDQPTAELLDKYHRWSELVKKKAPGTMRGQRQMLSIFNRWLEKRDLSELSIKDMAEFQDYFFKNFPFNSKKNHRHVSTGEATWNKYQEAISAFFNWCVRREIMSKNIIAGREFRAKPQKKPPRIPTKEEIAKILEWMDGQGIIISTFFRTLLYTGMRLSEAVNLKWTDINFKRGLITVTERKAKDYNTIPIHPELAEWLKKLPTKKNLYVFDSGTNEPVYHNNYYWKLLQEACRETGVKPMRVHDLRHATAGHLVMAGVDLVTVSRILGHSDIKQTMIYSDLYPEHIKTAIEKLKF
ncbi:MAG: tyrosine-type recombinase/integrase [Deltaproteobacteria bacterium]|nr:tyrosine-type recombinase/integrase [Deltaproteobacteria bacterium]